MFLFLNLPTGQVLGFTGQVAGSFGIAFGGTEDFCKGTSCLTLGANADVDFTLAATLPFGASVEISASVSTGTTVSLTGGCGEIDYEFGLKPLIGTGKLKLFNGVDYSVTRTIYTPTTNVKGMIPLQ